MSLRRLLQVGLLGVFGLSLFYVSYYEDFKIVNAESEERTEANTKDPVPGFNVAQNKVPFDIQLPNLELIPASLREEGTIVVKEFELSGSNAEKVDIVQMKFGEGRKHVLINQTIDTGKPPYIDELEPLDILDGEASLKRSEFGGPSRVYLWKDDLFFNIRVLELTEEQLIEISKSIANNY